MMARRREDTPDVKLSKFLSYICRHGAEKEGLHISDGGFVMVSDILALHKGRGFTCEDVQRVVANCSKKRFALEEDPSGLLQIRANQGHSIEVKDLDLVPIANAGEATIVVHGTNRRAWQSIKQQGLSRMGRSHIHFATGLPGESGVISGMRSNSHVLVFIDLSKALDDGLQFFRSANDVILSPGNKDGLILPQYFKKVTEL